MQTDDADSKTWVPLDRTERRVLGVLVEKAKTTPDNYPLSIAAIVAGANQKSNRAPQMQLDEDDVLVALDRLREVGAAREIQGSGRVTKYRHAAYEWLGVDAAGAAIMTELLLRGPQTVGELRSRASRMHDFPDLDGVQAVLQTLQAEGLVQAMSPPGRGQSFAHALYPPDEQQYLAQKISTTASEDVAADFAPSRAAVPAAAASSSAAATTADVTELQQKVELLEAEIEDLKRRLDRLES
jgi:uncharacterized protein YceH (UPF0502 family)